MVRSVFHALQGNKCIELIPNATSEEYYRLNVVVPFLDHLLQELTSRFNPENRVGKDIFYLVPTIVINQTDLNQVTKGLIFGRLICLHHHHYSVN